MRKNLKDVYSYLSVKPEKMIFLRAYLFCALIRSFSPRYNDVSQSFEDIFVSCCCKDSWLIFGKILKRISEPKSVIMPILG